MPRGKYVNHKGRSRHFTSPEELQKETDSEDESSNEEDGADGAGGSGSASKGAGTKPKSRVGKMPTSSEESDEDSDEDEGIDKSARKGVASLIEIENPNRAVKKAAQKVADLSVTEPAKPELTRKEREQLEKQKARARYEKLHAEGKTNEARADLARLALIKQQREEAAAKRRQELDAKKKTDDK